MRDVFVIGGGPAGVAAAIAARRCGFDVALADACAPPIDKACGECLMPEGVRALAALGVTIPERSCFPVRGIRFHDGARAVSAAFRNGAGLGVRRTALHRAMVQAAEREGVALLWGQSVRDANQIGARWIVACDGASSRIRPGVAAIASERLRFGFRVHYRTPPWTDFVDIHWAEGCQLYVTPVASDEVGVAVVSRHPALRVKDALAQFPAVRERLGGVAECSRERGGITANRVLRRVTRDNIALAGDASGSVDAVTAEGLSLSLRQAFALADALKRADLSRYEAAHRRLRRRPLLMANLLLMMDRFPAFRNAAFAVLSKSPGAFEAFLAFHTGAIGATSEPSCPGPAPILSRAAPPDPEADSVCQ